MPRKSKNVTKKLSVRLSLMIVLSVAILLTAALTVMFHYARKAIREEALHNAVQTLDGTILQIDNILLSVEQATGNIYWELLYHQNEPERMTDYCRQLVENNPYVTGCAIAFEPYFFKDRGKYFMTYVHQPSKGRMTSEGMPVNVSDTYGRRPYNEQDWYTITMETGRPSWIDPQHIKEDTADVITSFCLPIWTPGGRKVGVLGVDMELSLLSHIVHNAKPTPHSYCTLLGSDGSFIVHPDSDVFMHQTIFSQMRAEADTSYSEAAQAMMKGQAGFRHFRQKGTDYYVFFKPFRRAAVPGRYTEDLGWNIGIIYPDDDIFRPYNQLLYYVIAIALAGLLLLLLLCQWFTHRQLLPLQLLTTSAQHIAEGHYDTVIPDSRQHDEIGRLQDHFGQMQQALALHIGHLEQLRATLQLRGEQLSKAYGEAKAADRLKTTFLHNLTNQMLGPAGIIAESVDSLYDAAARQDRQTTERLADNIQQQGEAITHALDTLLQDDETELKQTI